MKLENVFFPLVACILFTCGNSPTTGTGDEVNNGSLFGKVLSSNDNKPIDDTVTVLLYKDTTADTDALEGTHCQKEFRTMTTNTGSYEFKSLPEGIYCIKVTRDLFKIGEKEGINLERNKEKKVDITVDLTINVVFNIQANESQIINNFYLENDNDNADISETDSGFTLSFDRFNTPRFYIEIKEDEDTSIVEVRAIRNDDGTLTFVVLENSAGLAVISESDMLSVETVSTFNVAFDGNGYTTGELPVKKVCISGDTVSLSERTGLIRLGYAFTGWNTESDGSGTDYEPGEDIIVEADDITLFAQWDRIEINYGIIQILARDSSFLMGSKSNCTYEIDSGETKKTITTFETPVHTVAFNHDFLMDSTEVTQLQYASLMAATYTSPEYHSPEWDFGSGDGYPAYNLNWYDAVLYCNARTLQSGSNDTVYSYSVINGVPGNGCTLVDLKIDLTKSGFRLPTEAEWEYACRAGSTTDFYWGKDYDSTLYPINEDDSCEIDSYIVWHGNAYNESTGEPYGASPVAGKLPNSFGLYDMIGNVQEWCNDRYSIDYYSTSPKLEPTGPETGGFKIVKGGAWRYVCPKVWLYRSSVRWGFLPEIKLRAAGFRVVLQLR